MLAYWNVDFEVLRSRGCCDTIKMYRGLAIFTQSLVKCFQEASEELKIILHSHFRIERDDHDEKYTEYSILREADKDIAFLIGRLKETKVTKSNSDLSSLDFVASGLVNLIEAIAPAIRMLLSPYLIDLVIGESEDGDFETFDLQFAHLQFTSSKDAEIDNSVNNDAGYMDLYRILDTKRNFAWIPAPADSRSNNLRSKVDEFTFAFPIETLFNRNGPRENPLDLIPIHIKDEELSGNNALLSSSPGSQQGSKAKAHPHLWVSTSAETSQAKLFDLLESLSSSSDLSDLHPYLHEAAHLSSHNYPGSADEGKSPDDALCT